MSRNFACADYDTCLNKAVDLGALDFTCEPCPRRHEVRPDWPEVQAADVEGVVDLWCAALNTPEAS